jgi:phage/plasmid primase-like uncharacterized protein
MSARPEESFRAAVMAAVGNAPELIEPGKMQRFATGGRRNDTAGWCKLFDDLGAGAYGCHRQGINEKWFANDRAKLTHAERVRQAQQFAHATAERAAEQRQQWAASAQRIGELQRQCVSLVPSDPVTLYLKRRGFGGVWPLPACLQLHRSLTYWHEGKCLGIFAAMVAPLVALDGRTVALHRTYLTSDGRKAAVPSVRKVTRASGPLAGACIPLFKPVNGCIGIAEGVETALAARCASSLPTVAAYCADNLAAWQWPSGVQRLVIFADNDKAGAEAADKLRQRAQAAQLQVRVLTPSKPGDDWCDVWAMRQAVEGAAA